MTTGDKLLRGMPHGGVYGESLYLIVKTNKYDDCVIGIEMTYIEMTYIIVIMLLFTICM